MLHVTTEVGKVGKKERERRHFPHVHNTKSNPIYFPRGRRFIPHNYGTDVDWVPHGQYIDPKPTDAGPDWSSRLRYIPDPDNPDYPAAEIWPNNWRSMRPYPCKPKKDTESLPPLWKIPSFKNLGFLDLTDYLPTFVFPEGTYSRSDREWLLDPGLTKVGLRCYFDGEHKATTTSEDEITHTMRFGKGRPEYMVDKRNEQAEAAPGDKSYQAPEYSPSFHKLGCTRPLTTYGPARSLRSADTFIPLTPLQNKPGEPFQQREKGRELQKEIDEVRKLEAWKPATPLPLTLPIIDNSEASATSAASERTRKETVTKQRHVSVAGRKKSRPAPPTAN